MSPATVGLVPLSQWVPSDGALIVEWQLHMINTNDSLSWGIMWMCWYVHYCIYITLLHDIVEAWNSRLSSTGLITTRACRCLLQRVQTRWAEELRLRQSYECNTSQHAQLHHVLRRRHPPAATCPLQVKPPRPVQPSPTWRRQRWWTRFPTDCGVIAPTAAPQQQHCWGRYDVTRYSWVFIAQLTGLGSGCVVRWCTTYLAEFLFRFRFLF